MTAAWFSFFASARSATGKRKRSSRGSGSHERGNDKQENPPPSTATVAIRTNERRRRSSPVFSPFPVLCSREPPRLHNPLRQSSHRSLARPRTPWRTSSGPDVDSYNDEGGERLSVFVFLRRHRDSSHPFSLSLYFCLSLSLFLAISLSLSLFLAISLPLALFLARPVSRERDDSFPQFF